MDIILLVILAIGAGFAGGYYLGFKHCSARIINELTDMVMDNISDLKHEVVGEQHYLYYADNGEFAAQGATLDAAALAFSERDKTVGRVMTALGTAFFIVDGKIETQ